MTNIDKEWIAAFADNIQADIEGYQYMPTDKETMEIIETAQAEITVALDKAREKAEGL